MQTPDKNNKIPEEYIIQNKIKNRFGATLVIIIIIILITTVAMTGVYFVKDKMHHRWKNKIDIYMGEDVKKTRKWGRKKIKIYYLVQKDSLPEI